MTPDEIRARVERYAESPEEVERIVEATLARLSWRLSRGVKECSRCHLDKSPAEFGLDGSQRDGLARICTECRREIRRAGR